MAGHYHSFWIIGLVFFSLEEAYSGTTFGPAKSGSFTNKPHVICLIQVINFLKSYCGTNQLYKRFSTKDDVLFFYHAFNCRFLHRGNCSQCFYAQNAGGGNGRKYPAVVEAAMGDVKRAGEKNKC